jgi:hypothetical protein
MRHADGAVGSDGPEDRVGNRMVAAGGERRGTGFVNAAVERLDVFDAFPISKTWVNSTSPTSATRQSS